MNTTGFFIYLAVITVIFIVVMVIITKKRKKKKDKGNGTNIGEVIENDDTPKQQTHIEKVNVEVTIETVDKFFNSKHEEGYNDALKDDTVENLREGLMRIKSEGKQLCDTAILAYQKKIRKLENEITEENSFLEGRQGNSTQADRKTVEKDNIQKDIDYIEEKKESLENNDLNIYASYRAGFAKGRSDKKI